MLSLLALSKTSTLKSWTRMVHGSLLVLSISIPTLALEAHQTSRVTHPTSPHDIQFVHSLTGSDDTNSVKAPILPWLRSLDGLNTHDDSYELARSGGVTTAQILPGSANNIGMVYRCPN